MRRLDLRALLATRCAALLVRLRRQRPDESATPVRSRSSRPRRCSATSPAQSAARRRTSTSCCSRTATRTTTSRAPTTSSRSPTPPSCCERRGLDDWIAEVVEQSGGDAAASSTSARGCRSCAPDGDGDAIRTGGTTRATSRRRSRAIRDALARANPSARAAYARNAAAYVRRLRALDAAHRAPASQRSPPTRRKLVTDHDAFGYFADRYGLAVVGTVIPSLTTQAQPSAGDLAELEPHDRARARRDGLLRAVGQREARAGDRARDRRPRRRLALRRHARSGRIGRRRPTSRWSATTPTRSCAG